MKNKVYWLGVTVCAMLVVYLIAGFSLMRK